MPELPEVETTRLGILSAIKNKKLNAIDIRQRRLRQIIAPDFETHCLKQTVKDIERRAKYLKVILNHGYILIHLGMSGHLRLVHPSDTAEKHAHVDFIFNKALALRYTDPRRFGLIQWSDLDDSEHPLLKHLGPEPLEKHFNAQYLFKKIQHSQRAIKNLIMDAKIVVGVGNIYAQESLFKAAIHPQRPGTSLSLEECQKLTRAIKTILRQAVKSGGTTLKDFYNSDGKPGYFAQNLLVYGLAGEACGVCCDRLEQSVIGGRSTIYCPSCQL